jgi:pimeloyl-ACP methyl ester carboxylesterase
MPNHIHWFESRLGAAPRGVALAAHGLNLNPDRMLPVVTMLTGAGLDVLRLSLRGHGANFTPCSGMADAKARLESFRSATREIWQAEVRSAWDHAHERARRAGVPLLMVGHSLGALLGVDLLADGAEFERMVLFAPALSLRRWHLLMAPLTPFPRLVIPSLAGSDIFANPGTPVAAYNALVEAVRRFETRNGAGINIPTLVVIDPGDELVSCAGIEEMIRARGLRRWRIHRVRKDAGVSRRIPRHLVLDRRSVGPGAWNAIGRAVAGHLAAGPA